jgi:hypothetical protein
MHPLRTSTLTIVCLFLLAALGALPASAQNWMTNGLIGYYPNP